MKTPVKPYKNSDLGKKDQIAQMFDNIAPRYDFLNHTLSLGIDKLWRRTAINSLKAIKPKKILDVATGTGDFAIAALRLKPHKVIGIDISKEMLVMGRKKLEKQALTEKIELLTGDSENLEFDDNTFDAVTVAFGVRNFENLVQGLTEMNRVMRVGGKVAILEFSQPKRFPIKQGFQFYFKNVLPKIGRMVSKDASAYTYLPASVQAFPEGNDFLAIMKNVGFKSVKCKELSFGICSLYTARK